MTRQYRQHILTRAIFASLLATTVVMPAVAQTVQEERKPADARDASTLDAVIVTVERREQDLQKYAGTAQAISADDARALGINNELRNIQALVPGMSMANQEGNLEIFIRGVGSSNNTELGDPGAAPHINGAYIPRPRGLGGMFYDIERVEINKGPQGTLRGRNALAGTLNIITARPDLDAFGGYVQVEAGNRDHRGGEFALNFPLGGWAALRVAGYKVEKDSPFENAGRAQELDPAGIQDDRGARVSFLYQPDEKLSVFAMADMGKEGGTGYPGANVYTAARAGYMPDDVDLRKVIYRGAQGALDSTNWGAQASVSYDFGPVVLEYNTSYRDVDFRQTNAQSEGILWPGRNIEPLSDSNPGGIDYDNYSTQYWMTKSQSQVHELRLSSHDDTRLRWTTGLFHFDEDQEVGYFSLADKGRWYSGTEFTMPEVNGRSSAVFADGTFDVNDRLRVKGGLRYTKEEKSRYGIGGNWALGLPGTPADDAPEGWPGEFATRLGTPGFAPAFMYRPNFDVTGLTSPAEMARFLLQGILSHGRNDTILEQIGGVANGGDFGCVDRVDIGGEYLNCPYQDWVQVNGIPAQQFGRSKFNFTDWRVGFEYDLSADNLLYGLVSSGHKAGGFNDTFDPEEIPETFKPESIIAYELGSKNSFGLFDRTSTFNVSAFYYDYRDQVFQDLAVIATNPSTGEATGFALVNRNVGKSAVYGVEAESVLRLPYSFILNLNALWLDSEIKQGTVADVRSQNWGVGGATSLIDLSGNELPLASKLTFNMRLQHSMELPFGTLDWQVLASYRSAFYLTQYNNRDVEFIRKDQDTGAVIHDRTEDAASAGFPDRQRGETMLNAGIGLTTLDGRWRFEAWGNNLLDNDVSQKALVGSGINVRFLNDPRSYGLRVRYQF
ncbi:TonB-dependent receptor [Marilutibacter alkalisoli]|uniref:TonB-dependent receptor n=1 Tax=Marilutibacter alkalisoli TaxID=2591633 RepID=A0A514BWS2_9GAMM|nr:TonB-dependent receptor [Lysobacter alkalisoli]QDH71439.1 TonB-dependent receptor [Lysobacter alkalisoli]